MPFFSFSFSKSSPNIPFDDEPWLPGAWASVWSLSHQNQSIPDQSTNGLPHIGNERHHASTIPTMQDSSINVESNAQPFHQQTAIPKSVRHSIDYDDNLSLLSEEYHSFDSHGDVNGIVKAEDLNTPSSITACQPRHELQSSLQPDILEEGTSNARTANSTCPPLSTNTSAHSFIQAPDLAFGDPNDMVYRHPRSSSCLLGIPEHSVTPAYSSSRENSIYSNYPRSLTTDSATDASDTNSVRSEQSSNVNEDDSRLYLDRASTSTIELQEPLQHTFRSQLLITSSLPPATISSPPTSFQVLDFAQPDGDNSWTLALDPVAGAHELSSQASSSSLATTSSSANTESTHDVSEAPEIPFPSASPSYIAPSARSNMGKEPPKRLFLRERVVSTPYRSQGSTPSVRDNSLSTPTRPSFGDSIIATPTGGYAYSGPSRENIPQPLESPYSPYHSHLPTEDKSKKAVWKPKVVVTKIKQLFNTKPGKTKFRDTDHPPRSSASPVGHHAPPSPMSTTFPSGNNALHRTISPSSSVYQSFGMPRSVKLSTPSVAFSSMHDSNSTRTRTNSNLNLEDKLTYEYHARPKTLDEIRSKRRFSLPSVLAGSGGRSTPSSSSYNIANNSSMTRIGLRPVSTRRNTSNVPH
ncbi:hypothetical protein BJ165DRAFT_492037 [Panaeolus papilionaceus]|nr:hypothetical protein BJ165DRAFT_492037 [Panaeolus papilionaceus]